MSGMAMRSVMEVLVEWLVSEKDQSKFYRLALPWLADFPASRRVERPGHEPRPITPHGGLKRPTRRST